MNPSAMKSFLFLLSLALCCFAGLPREGAAQDKDGIYISEKG